VLCDEPGAHREALALGAGLALEVFGAEPTLAQGIQRARAAIDDGSAQRLLERLREFSKRDAAAEGC